MRRALAPGDPAHLLLPHHSQTNGKIERFHETLKARLNLLVYTSPEVLRAAMADFIRFYNHERYHEGIGNVTPADVYDGRRDAILQRRAAQKSRTLARRVRHNRAAAMQGTPGRVDWRPIGSAQLHGVPMVLTTDSHTYATRPHELSVDLLVIQRLQGHESVATMKIYTRVSAARQAILALEGGNRT